MKQLKLLFLICCMTLLGTTVNAQNIGGDYHLNYAVDANGNRIGNNVKRISVVLYNMMGTPMLSVHEHTVIGGVEMSMSANIVPGSDWLNYAGVSNGWQTFTWHGTVNVFIQGNTIRVEKRGIGNQYLGYSEYVK